jgi:hypothetical protein
LAQPIPMQKAKLHGNEVIHTVMSCCLIFFKQPRHATTTSG